MVGKPTSELTVTVRNFHLQACCDPECTAVVLHQYKCLYPLKRRDVSNNRIGGNYPDSLAKALGKNFR